LHLIKVLISRKFSTKRVTLLARRSCLREHSRASERRAKKEESKIKITLQDYQQQLCINTNIIVQFGANISLCFFAGQIDDA